jgi:hypothetical protein
MPLGALTSLLVSAAAKAQKKGPGEIHPDLKAKQESAGAYGSS